MKEKQRNKSTKVKRLLSLILTAAMAVTLLPAAVFPAVKAEAAEVTLSNPQIVEDSSMEAGQKVTWDCVWFGSYPQAEVVPSGEYTALDESLLQDGDIIVSDSIYNTLQSASGWDDNNEITLDGTKYRRMQKGDATYSYTYQWSDSTTYHYFKYEPIKWRVLHTDGNQALLLSDAALDDQQYNTKWDDVTWETSTIRSWLNGYGAESNQKSEDYSQKNFIDSAFTASEQEAIIDSPVENADNITWGTDGGSDTIDKVFLLSESEVWNTDQAASYGFVTGRDTYDEARRSKSSTYAKAMGTWSNTNATYAGNCWWWLRSPGYNEDIALIVSNDGRVYSDGNDVNYKYAGVRAALNLNLSSSNLYSYAGTVCSDGSENETGGTVIPGGDEPNPSTGGNLQCPSSCAVETGSDEYITLSASAENYDDLKKLTDSVTWTSGDTSIVTVDTSSFVLPVSSTKLQTEDGNFYERWYAAGILRIYGISEGSTTITGSASDGTRVTCSVTVSAPASDGNGGGGEGGSLILGANQSGSADSSSGVSSFFPDTWSLKSAVFPVELSVSEESDGTHKVKGAVGIGKSDWLDDEAAWSKYKKNVSDAQEYMGKYNRLSSLRKTMDVKFRTAVSTDKFKVLPKLSVMGYFENKYDKNWNLISQTGKVAMDAKWSGSISWQFATPIGPLYLNLKGSGKLSGKIGPLYDYSSKTLKIVDGNLKLTPSVVLEGGYGIDKVATVGAQGTLSLPITLIPATKGEFSAKAALHVKLVFVIDYTHDLAAYKKTLWDTTEERVSEGITLQDALSTPQGTLREMDTSFAEYTSAWNGGGAEPEEERAGDSVMASESVLQTGVLESTLPLQAEINGKRVMVFQAYDGSRTTLNSSVLMYSVYENGVWSEPAAVWDNGCADLYADLKVVDHQLVLAWQKEKTAVDGDVSNDSDSVLKDFAKNSEICFASFDEASNTFTNQTYVTDNDFYDMMPQICEGSSDVILSWVRNDEADLMQESGKNAIYTARWDGSAFEQEEVRTQSPGTIDAYVAYQDGQGIQTVFTGQSDNMTAVFDSDGQVAEELVDLMMFSEDGRIASLNYADGRIHCISNGVLYSYDPVLGEVTEVLAGESAFGSSVQYCSNGDKGGYLWSLYDEETGIGSIQASMKTEEGYSEPVTLYEQEGVIWRYLAPVLDEEGNWQITANAQDVESGLNSLVSIGKQASSDIELTGASVDEKDVVDGMTGVDYFITNTGETPVYQLELVIEMENGETITQTVPVTVLPGESMAGTAYVDLSEVDTAQEIKISVYSENQSDMTACTVADTVGLPDVSVTGSSKESEDKVTVTATVSNDSRVDADMTLHLFSDETKETELDRAEAVNVRAGEKQEIQFTVARNDVIYNDNNAAYLTIYAEVPDGDYDEDNNTAYAVLYKSGTQIQTPTGIPSSTPIPAVTSSPHKSHVNQTFAVNGLKYKVTKDSAAGCEVRVTGMQKNTKTLKIPATVTNSAWKETFKVTSVKAKAFKGKNITKAVIGKNVTKIGPNAFLNCKKLKRVTIGKSVKTVGVKAFYGCRTLKKVTIKSTALKNVKKNAFKRISAKAVIKVPKSKKKEYTGYLKGKIAKGVKVK